MANTYTMPACRFRSLLSYRPRVFMQNSSEAMLHFRVLLLVSLQSSQEWH